jgi:hypothetical protein
MNFPEIMKSNTQLPFLTLLFLISFLVPKTSFSQCDIFKSEIKGVQEYMYQVSKLTDSLSTSLEIASFDASLSASRKNADIAKKLLGEAVNITYDAAAMMDEAFYYSERCGEEEVVSNTIVSERFTIDTRDVIDEAFQNTKMGIKANNLGNLQYHMRIAQRLLREVKDSAEQAAYFADMAHYSCEHSSDHASRSDK